LIGILKSYLKQGITNKSINSNYEEELRQNASNIVDKTFKNKYLKKWSFNFVLRKARALVSNTENLRYERTRGFGMVRTMFSELGKRWKEEGYLGNERDIFHLELEEIKAQSGKVFDKRLIQKIENRKQEFEEYKTQKSPMERFYSFGNEFTDEFIYSTEKTELAEENLSGTGCCPGIVKGKVRIVEDPNEIESLDGDILVTSSTDPGWVTLFPTASAILVERGSLLSHSAIVSREMGIPCIVSVTGLLRTLKTGDEIEINGSTGSIKLIEK
jgi:pyruvate,water dikinase